VGGRGVDPLLEVIMFPELFKIGNITIYSYGLMMALGILGALALTIYRGKRKGYNVDIITDLSFYAVIGGIIGAKLLYFITEAKYIIQSPGSILDMLTSGFVVYGAILGGVISGFIYCRIKKLKFLEYFDLIVPSLAFAQGIGRIGCLLAGCCYGKETSSFIGIIFKHSLYAPNGVRLVPTQILSSLGDFMIAIILIIFARAGRKSGQVAGLYLVLYSVGRFFIEFFRNDPRGTIGALTTSQFICIFILISGIILLCKDRFKILSSRN
jgi:phosphatidylglycerol---prolipoprotein diacylglyceryl transferase